MGETSFSLYGPAPDLAGFAPVPPEGVSAGELEGLPLLALLWEAGWLDAEKIQISSTSFQIIDLTGGRKLHIISY